MANGRMVVFGVVLIAAGVGGYLLLRAAPAAPIAGVVRATEIRLAPEVGGQLATIKVERGARVRAGDVVAELSVLGLTPGVALAPAAMVAGTGRADSAYGGSA